MPPVDDELAMVVPADDDWFTPVDDDWLPPVDDELVTIVPVDDDDDKPVDELLTPVDEELTPVEEEDVLTVPPVLLLLLLLAHSAPENPVTHEQLNPLTRSTHVPPLRHGIDAHSLTFV